MSVIANQQLIGKIMSIACLSLVAPSTYLFRRYSRSLDFAQMLIVFSAIYAPTTVLFSNNLKFDFLSFMNNFLNFCTSGDYVCTYGYILSPGVAWLGGVILFFILFKILACCGKQVKYVSFYNFWKGFMRWFMPPLVYYNTTLLIPYIQNNTISSNMNNVIPLVAVLAFFIVWSFVQLIGYKLIENSQGNGWKKIIQFWSHWNIAITMALVAVSNKSADGVKYFIYGPWALNFLIVFLKQRFTFNFFQKLFFFLTEAIIVTVYSIFIFKPTYIFNYDLDLFGLGIVIILQILVFFPKFIHHCKNGDEEEGGSEVHPEDRSISKMRKENSFGPTDLYPQNSHENLNNSFSPPKQGNKRR